MAYTSIDNPELYFQVKIYTGTGSSNALTLDGDTDMQPDLVYLKRRDADAPPMFFDAIRGATKRLQTNNTDAEATGSEQLTAFGSDGFTVGTNSDANNSSATYVAWCWKESATSGFDIDSNSGTGSARTEAHSLSAVPHVIFMKSTNDTTNWAVYHHRNTSAPATDYLRLNDSRATADDAERWNTRTPRLASSAWVLIVKLMLVAIIIFLIYGVKNKASVSLEATQEMEMLMDHLFT